MKSITDVFKIGLGPSSSHTMGPDKAANIFLNENPEMDAVKIILYGSLAKTGKGHHTDVAVTAPFSHLETELIIDTETGNLPHENTMDFFGYKNGEQIAFMRAMSIGGGDISIQGRPDEEAADNIYPENNFTEIAEEEISPSSLKSSLAYATQSGYFIVLAAVGKYIFAKVVSLTFKSPWFFDEIVVLKIRVCVATNSGFAFHLVTA